MCGSAHEEPVPQGDSGPAGANASSPLKSEDWWSAWFGGALLLAAAAGLIGKVPRMAVWTSNPLDALTGKAAGILESPTLVNLGLLLLGLGALTALGMRVMGCDARRYLHGFTIVFLLAVAAQVLGQQARIKANNLEVALWAIVIGLMIANTLGTPKWMLAGARSEMFIKTGLVMMGAEILFQRIVKLGGPGLIVTWIVTPAVIIFMWLLGTRVLKMTSRSLVIVIACATSVCGVSAAIASAAAARAKKDELTLAVGMTMVFTVAMMIGMPALCRAIGLDQYVAGAWIGGTVDSTGAVAAAGALLGRQAEQVAGVIKMIQNVLIGLIAFVIAVYWVTSVERDASAPRPSPIVIWTRFPKFVLGFLAASMVFSFLLVPALGDDRVDAIQGVTKGIREWFFCLAFVSIGLESNFRKLVHQLVGGKPIMLYIIGQTFNIILTLVAAYVAFGGVLFDRPA